MRKSVKMPTLAERIEGGIVGLLIGDALGVPYEFHPPAALPPPDSIEFTPPTGFHRSHGRVRPGTWSDDGAQALALLASLLERGQLDLEDFGRRLSAWYRQGYMAVNGVVFDVGIQTRRAIEALNAGRDATVAGPGGERDNGNGSLMRVLPLALWHQGSDEELVAGARRQSLVTHGHLRAQLCCALYCLWARRTLQATADPWCEAVQTMRRTYDEKSSERAEMEAHIRPDSLPHGEGTGYVVDCLHSARLALEAGSYEAVVKAAVALGNDTDTTACVAGGIAGIRDGVNAIPERWRRALRGREMVRPLLDQLLRHC
jgi:ADP-ribosyl-[dinitrogen reductase] hydrolase